MKSQGEVGDDDCAGLRTAKGDLIVGFRIFTAGVQADDRESFGCGPAQVFTAERTIGPPTMTASGPAEREHPRVSRGRHRRQIPIGEAREGRQKPMLGLLEQPLRPRQFLAPSPRITIFIAGLSLQSFLRSYPTWH